MTDIWEDSEYTVCPACNQVVRKEELTRGAHFCQNVSRLIWMTLPAID